MEKLLKIKDFLSLNDSREGNREIFFADTASPNEKFKGRLKRIHVWDYYLLIFVVDRLWRWRGNQWEE
ncbi:MAG TPA: hypothetical protein VMD74_01915, partial [Candidatus Methylomirabilis sp.]|nr:hypothetical protein [Candidatus Methylomirabilis sp.]